MTKINYPYMIKNIAYIPESLVFHNAIKKMLFELLNNICNISPDKDYHDYFIIKDNKNNYISYEFNYNNELFNIGKVAVYYYGDSIRVNFKFSKNGINYNLPAGHDSVSIFLDDDLKYKYALFEKKIELGFNYTNVKNRIILSMNTYLDSFKNFNPSVVANIGMISQPFIISENESTYLYFSNNHHFHNLFKKFYLLFDNEPDIFHSIFKDYPSQIEISSDIDVLTKFLNLFHDEYIKDYSLIESSFLLKEIMEI